MALKLRINHIRKAIKQGKVIKVPRSDINEEEFSKLFKKILEWMDPDNDDYDFTTVFAMHNGDVSELIQNIDIANKCLLDDIKFMTSEESGLAHFTNSEVEDVIGFAEWKIDKIKDSFKRQIFNMNLYKKFDNWEIVKDVTMKYLELVTNVLRDEYTWLKRAKIVDPTTKRGDDEVNEYFALDDIINMTDEVVVEFDAGQAVQNGKAAVKDAGQQVKIWFKKMIANLVYNYNKLSLKSQLSYAQKMADKINHGANYKFQAHIIDPSTMKTLPDSKECAGIQAKSRELFRFFNTLGNSVEDIERLTGIADELIGVYKDDIITVSGIMKNSEWVDMSSDGVYESIDKLKEKVKELDTIIAEVKHALVLEKIWVDGNIWKKCGTNVKTLLMKMVQLIAAEMKLLALETKNTRVVKTADNAEQSDSNVQQEGFFTKKPKKLKPIPRDIIPYITIEMNAIQSENDQAMLAGYTCSKLELVDFYLNCIDTQDERYIVPHTRQYLVQMQNDLNRLLAQILRVRPMNKMSRLWKTGVNLPG